jgi:CHAT domain-containing protein
MSWASRPRPWPTSGNRWRSGGKPWAIAMNLVIVPSGVFGKLPIELLVEPDATGAGLFLVEGRRIRYAPSLTSLHFIRMWERRRSGPERMLWALGDPVYHPTDERLGRQARPAGSPSSAVLPPVGGPRGAGLERLPFSGWEVDRIAALLGAGPDDQLIGAAATEAAVKRLSARGVLARYRYLHFACHGELGTTGGTWPGLVLAQYDDGSGEDGTLRLDEAAGLGINADLVILSACQTGLGLHYESEGVVGLARAFLNAGSRGVLCSLWRVADRETSELMVDVYAGLKAGRPAAEALGDAQRKMIAAGQPPLYWAPFVLIGR